VLPLTPALAIAAAWRLANARWPRWAAPALVAVLAIAPWFFAGQDEKAGSVRPVARYLEEHGHQPWVFECGPFVAGLPYYLGTTVPLVDVQRDVRFATPSEQSILWSEIPTARYRGGEVWVFGEQQLVEQHLPPGMDAGVRLRWRKYALMRPIQVH